MTVGHVPNQAQLPIALCVATEHEARIVQRAIRSARVSTHVRSNFNVVLVGVSCCDMDSNVIIDNHSAIVSTGFAGALQSGLDSGSLLFPESVKKADNTSYTIQRELQKKMTSNTANVAAGSVLHTDVLLATIEQKRVAHVQSGCAACDMESASLAAAAVQGNCAFACLRIVLDPANTVIPEPIVGLANSGGEPSAIAFLSAVCKKPGQLPATAVFLWHTFKASQSLVRSVKQLVEGYNP